MLGALANVSIFALYMVASSSLVNRDAVQFVSFAKLYPVRSIRLVERRQHCEDPTN